MKRICVVIGMAAAGLLAGCAPSAQFVKTDCRVDEAAARGGAVRIVSTFRCGGVTGDQVLYSMTVLDARGQPVRSRDASYRDEAGNVAASRALFSPRPDWVFEDEALTIPLDQLDVRAADLPVTALITVREPGGPVLGSSAVKLNLPYQFVQDLPDAQPKPAPEEKPVAAARRPAARPEAATSRPARAAAREAPRSPADERAARPRPASAPAAAAERSAPASRPAAAPPAREAQAPRPPAEPKPAPATRPATPTSRPSAPAARAASGPAVIEREGVRIYVVQPGDTLSSIARNVLGDATRWPELYMLNRDVLEAPDAVRPGIELKLPSAGPARQKPR